MIMPQKQVPEGTKHLGCVMDRNFWLRAPDRAPKDARHWIILHNRALEDAEKL